MQEYKKQFIEFALEVGALRFGEFTLKSGRTSPYFFNAGEFKTGAQLSKLASFYAATVNENLFGNSNQRLDETTCCLFGPAYKGIPLVSITALKLAENHDVNLPICYNRKEAKDHGEGGSTVGHKLESNHNVIVIEDVITAGTAIGETKEVLKNCNNPNLSTVIIAVDRCEVKQEGACETAIEEIAKENNVKIYPIVTIREIAEYLGGNEQNAINSYLEKYGPQPVNSH